MTDLPTRARVVVIGGGVVGCSTAYHLVKLGWLVSYQRQGSGVVYGLNRDRREKLRKFLEGAADLR